MPPRNAAAWCLLGREPDAALRQNRGRQELLDGVEDHVDLFFVRGVLPFQRLDLVSEVLSCSWAWPGACSRSPRATRARR